MKHLWRQNHNDKPVRVSWIFSRPESVKTWEPNFKIKTVNWSLRQLGRVMEKREVNYIINPFVFVFFLFFYHSSCRKDQFTVLILKFGIKVMVDLKSLKSDFFKSTKGYLKVNSFSIMRKEPTSSLETGCRITILLFKSRKEKFLTPMWS